jgi:hypothetical protein
MALPLLHGSPVGIVVALYQVERFPDRPGVILKRKTFLQMLNSQTILLNDLI